MDPGAGPTVCPRPGFAEGTARHLSLFLMAAITKSAVVKR